ncbi:MAG TPA: putative LPS assembly protein LptD, partial [Longimicrobiales bacterium]|nr:putative LPS assembly protein LptD [Longimicrobiales bacterium]
AVTYRKFWKQEGGSDFTIATDNSWEPDERTRLGINGEYTTSTEFVRQRTFDPAEVNRNIASFGSLRRTFDWGGVSLGVSRRQQLSDNTVTTVLPNLDVTFSPVTLFEALPGEERFYSNVTWSGSATSRIEHRGIDLALAPNSMQAGRTATAGGSSSFNMGDLGLRQQFNYNEQRRDEREVLREDSTLHTLPGVRDQRGTWSASVNYTQRLIGNTRLTPNLSMDGEFVSNEASEFRTVTAPLRARFGASLATEIYGFWPGAGPFERLRHKISPSLDYSYSPEAKADSIQRAVFSGAGVAEQNQIRFGFSQTFEAKYKSRPEDDEAEAGTRGEQAAADSAQDGLRRRQQSAVINLLSINTEAIGYDFVQARERGDGITTASLTNTIQSDLLRGLQLTVTHDLFRSTAEEGAPISQDGPIQREFAPHLSSLNTGFSLNGGSWLFRLLRLGAGDTVPTDRSAAPMQAGNPMAAGPAVDRTESEYGMVGTSRRTAPGAPRGAVGSWNANFTYTLARSREEVPDGRNEQMVKGDFTFQPTANWAVTWRTGYTFEKSQFTDHVLTLSRTLHDWDANFDFVKAQNGNFSFQFRVHLRANPDIKLDYSQSDAQGVRRSTGSRL